PHWLTGQGRHSMKPPTADDAQTDAGRWLAFIWQRWPGGHPPQLARLLAEELAEPTTLDVNLNHQAVQRILHQVHLRPPALRQLLAKLTEAGLLVQLQLANGVDWGEYRLELPRCSHLTAPAC